MRALLVLPFIVAALAGCLSDDAPVDPTTTRPLEVLPPQLVTPGASGETFLAVHPDPDTPTILACTHGGFIQPSPTYVSRDGGDTWTRFVTGTPVGSGDCDVAFSDAGAWAVLYDTVVGSSTAVSRDDGATWTVNHHGAPPVTGAVDRPWIEWVDERLVLSWKSVQYHPTVLATAYSDDDGATWTTPQVLDFALDPEYPAALPSDFHRMDDGALWIFLTSYQTNPAAGPMGFSTQQRYETFESTDAGETWTRSLVHEGAGEVINGAAVGGDQYVWWAYAGPAEDGNGESIWILLSTDRGATWSAPTAVAHGDDFDTPAIAGRADGTASLLLLEKGEPAVDLLRLDAAADGLVVDTARVMGPTTGIFQSAEFMDITHAPDGRAIGIFAWDLPDQDCTGSMNVQATFCLWLTREATA